MARPRIYTPPVSVEEKQIPVDYLPSPQPTALNLAALPEVPLPQDLSPYTVDVGAQQPYVEPIKSAITQALFGLAMKGYQPPASAPYSPGYPSLGEPPVPGLMPPPDSPGTAFASAMQRPLREFTPPERTSQRELPQLEEPPLTH